MLKIDFDAVIQRWRAAAGASSELDLCRKSGLSASAISVYRKRGHLPYAHIVECCAARRVSVDWVLFGPAADRLGRPEA